MRVAGENFALLNEGLDVAVTVTIDHNTLPSNSVLALAIMISLTGLGLLYRSGKQVYAREEARRQNEREELREREEEQQKALAALETQKDDLAADMAVIQSELSAARDRAASNEADLFEEVESLENNLETTLKQQMQQQNRIRELEDHLDRLAKEREALAAQQTKVAGGLRKRMETLYKHTVFSDRSLSGLVELPEPMQIKAEEIIHQLNAHADEVPIKRKLFRGKGKETVFEIVFAHKGRLYFRRTRDRKVDILAIGTKNTQERDLVYLDRSL
jgi:predicted  nucleic acid-binding Zn-ribbon protein